MNFKKVIGTLIIGTTLALSISLLTLLIIIKSNEPFSKIIYSYFYHGPTHFELTGKSLFLYILIIGLSITLMIAFKYVKNFFKVLLYSPLIGVIIGIVLAVAFPKPCGNDNYEFNYIIFTISAGACLFVSLIALGIYMQKK
jgi:hypothetical protein